MQSQGLPELGQVTVKRVGGGWIERERERRVENGETQTDEQTDRKTDGQIDI
jgi:hypothetical protein